MIAGKGIRLCEKYCKFYEIIFSISTNCRTAGGFTRKLLFYGITVGYRLVKPSRFKTTATILKLKHDMKCSTNPRREIKELSEVAFLFPTHMDKNAASASVYPN